MKFYIPEMTYEEIAEAIPAATLLIPVACMEQHGRHLPVHTDMDNCQAIVMGAAKALNPGFRTLVGPPVWYSPGGSFDLAKFPGTLKMRKEVFMEALRDLLESYLRSGFKRIVVVNGHGGGTQLWIPEVVRYLRRDLPRLGYKDNWTVPAEAKVTTFMWQSLIGAFANEELKAITRGGRGSDWHAGEFETALQLYLRPDLVQMDKAVRGEIRVPSKFGTCDLQDFNREYIIPNMPAQTIPGDAPGVWGDPTVATAETGKAYYDLGVRMLKEFVEEYVRLS